MGAYMTTPDNYGFTSDPYNAGTGEYNDFAAYPAPQSLIDEMPSAQPEMTGN